jgi:hypothetical protein
MFIDEVGAVGNYEEIYNRSLEPHFSLHIPLFWRNSTIW